MNTLLDQYPQEVAAILAKYPSDQKRAAVMPLLYLAQRKLNYITKRSLSEIAEIIGVSPTDVASIVGFYTLYHAEPGGKYRIQVCTDLPCALRGADEFFEKLCENMGVQVGETTSDGLVTLEHVTCLAACDHAPMFQVQTGEGLTYHHDQTLESTLALVEEWRSKEEAARQALEPQVSEQEGKPEQGTSTEVQPEPELGEAPRVAPAEDQKEGDLPNFEAPVLPTAEEGTTTLTREERVKIMQQGGQ
ncbi:MAG: complex I 24 kDa subunit family protein [Omnitrophica WOR_2 bacterium]